MSDILPNGNTRYVSKGWGFEFWLCNNDKYCGKQLFLKKGKKLSWHYHEKKDEVFWVREGEVVLFYGNDDDLEKAAMKVLTKGDVEHIPVGMRHRLVAVYDSEVIEFSTTHSDSDSIRVIKGD